MTLLFHLFMSRTRETWLWTTVSGLGAVQDSVKVSIADVFLTLHNQIVINEYLIHK